MKISRRVQNLKNQRSAKPKLLNFERKEIKLERNTKQRSETMRMNKN